MVLHKNTVVGGIASVTTDIFAPSQMSQDLTEATVLKQQLVVLVMNRLLLVLVHHVVYLLNNIIHHSIANNVVLVSLLRQAIDG